MNRIDATFEALQKQKGKAFVAYIVAGDPSLNQTRDIVLALEQAGANIIELGIPFSDPVADGETNQLGSQRALDSGTTISGIFDAVKKIRQKSQIPIVLFTYYNPVFHFGLKKFLEQAEQVGVDGVLILDLPSEEAQREWPKGSSIKRISLIAPTTPPNRIASICQTSSGFIYYVSREGVTGVQDKVAANLNDHIQRIREHTQLPICVGFGISKPEHVQLVASVADGVVVGSAIVNEIARHGKSSDLAKRIQEFVQPLTTSLVLK
jgi:tryptophan synthase alpha chain